MYIHSHPLLIITVSYLFATSTPFSFSYSSRWSTTTATTTAPVTGVVAAARIVTKSFDFNTDEIGYQRGKDWDLASGGLSRFTTKRGASLEVNFFGECKSLIYQMQLFRRSN